MAGIVSIAAYVPAELEADKEVARRYALPLEALRRDRVVARAVAGNNDHPSDMAAKALERAINAGGIAREDIELVIFTGIGRDYPDPWVVSFGVIEQLGLDATGFDLSSRCPGITDALWVANNLIEAGAYRTIAVCTGVRFDHQLPTGSGLSYAFLATYSPAGGAAILTDKAPNRIAGFAAYPNPNRAIHLHNCALAGGTRRPVDRRALDEDAHIWSSELTVEENAELLSYLGMAQRRNLSDVCDAAGFESIDMLVGNVRLQGEEEELRSRYQLSPAALDAAKPPFGHMGTATPLVALHLALAEGQPVGPRLVISMRTYAHSSAIAIGGEQTNLGIHHSHVPLPSVR